MEMKTSECDEFSDCFFTYLSKILVNLIISHRAINVLGVWDFLRELEKMWKAASRPQEEYTK